MAYTESGVAFDPDLVDELPAPDSYAARDPVDLMVSMRLKVRTWEKIDYCNRGVMVMLGSDLHTKRVTRLGQLFTKIEVDTIHR